LWLKKRCRVVVAKVAVGILGPSIGLWMVGPTLCLTGEGDRKKMYKRREEGIIIIFLF